MCFASVEKNHSVKKIVRTNKDQEKVFKRGKRSLLEKITR